MVDAKFHNYPDGGISMVLRGHAGSAPRGEDLVCAAVSILVYTAAEAVLDAAAVGKLAQPPQILMKEGFAAITARPVQKARPQVVQVFRLVQRGLSILARQFPDSVQVR